MFAGRIWLQQKKLLLKNKERFAEVEEKEIGLRIDSSPGARPIG